MDVATSLPAMCRAFLPVSVRCGHQPWNGMGAAWHFSVLSGGRAPCLAPGRLRVFWLTFCCVSLHSGSILQEEVIKLSTEVSVSPGKS